MQIRGHDISLTRIAVAVALVVAVASAVTLWHFPRQQVSRTEFVTLPKIRTVEKVKVVSVPGPKEIMVVEKESAEKRLHTNLPEKDQVLATAELPPSRGGYDVLATIDTERGTGQITAQERSPRLVEFINEGEIGTRCGISTDSGQTAAVHGRWEFIRVGALRLGAGAEVTSQPRAEATIGVTYRW